jgi:hypothetical protein
VMSFGARLPAFEKLARMYRFSVVHAPSRAAVRIHDFSRTFSYAACCSHSIRPCRGKESSARAGRICG